MSLGLAELRCNPLDKKEGVLKQHWYPFLDFRLWKERFPGTWNFPGVEDCEKMVGALVPARKACLSEREITQF